MRAQGKGSEREVHLPGAAFVPGGRGRCAMGCSRTWVREEWPMLGGTSSGELSTVLTGRLGVVTLQLGVAGARLGVASSSRNRGSCS